MNLFDNIIQSSKNNFLGTKPIVPSTPSFTTPQAPRTSSYIAPNTPFTPPKPTMTLFSDEQKMFQNMKADNLSDDTAYSMLKKRRMDILGGNDLGNDEKEMLLKMQADNVPVKQAVSMIQQRRKDQFNKKYEEGNLLQKGTYNTLAFAAGNLETVAKYGGNALDFITGGTMGFGDEVKKMEQVTQSPEFDSTAFKAGTYAPDVALAVSPIGGGYLAGAKGMTGLQGANLFSQAGAKNLTQGLIGRSAVVGAGFGGVQPILDKGSDATMEDIATGAAVGGAAGAIATPIIGKALKYGQAGYRGGLTGMGKSITRDVKAGVNAITPSGANISTKANRFNANEIREFTKRTGETPGQFATNRGMTKVGDDAVVEATNLWKASKDQADEALQAIKGRFRFTDEGEDLLKTTIDDLETRLVNTKSPDSKRISQLKVKYEDSGLSMSEINEIKRAYSNNYKYSFVDAGSESALRSKNLQDAVRKWQFKVAEENGLTNLKDINKTTQGWKMFADSLSKKIQGSSGNNNVSLTDWIALSGGGPENIALYLGKKLASSDTVKSGAIKLFSKKTKPSIIQASKADIQQANFKKDVNRGVSGVGDNSGGKSLVKPVGLIEAPKGQATGAKNFRVNQPKEAPIKNEGQVGNRPGTKATIKTPESVKLAKEAERQKQVIQVERDLNSALKSNYIPNKPDGARVFIERAMNDGKITREDAIAMVEKLYENADGFKKPGYGKFLDDLYSNKKAVSFDDLVNEKPVQTTAKTAREMYLETPKGMYETFRSQVGDRRYNLSTNDALIADFKKKTGWDLMKDGDPKFDADGNVVKVIKKPTNKPIVKPNTIKNESKVNKPVSSDTIPEGYKKNVFGEIVKKPSIKKGGFIKIPEIGKKVEPKSEFLKTIEKQLKGTGNDASIFKDGEFSYKTQSASELKTYSADSPSVVKEWEIKIKNGERPNVLTKTQNGATTVVDGNHKLTAYKNLGIKEIPTIDVKLKQVRTKNMGNALAQLDTDTPDIREMQYTLRNAIKDGKTTVIKNLEGFINARRIGITEQSKSIVKNPLVKKAIDKQPTISGVRKLLETEGIGTYSKSSSVSGSAIRNVSESGDIKISKPLTRTRNGELVTDKYVDNKGIIKVEKYINIDDRTKKLEKIMEVLDKNRIPYRKLGYDLFTTPNEGQTISGIEFDLSKLNK